MQPLIQHVDGLPGRVFIVLVREKRDVIKVMVGKPAVEGNGAPTLDHHMLIHPAILDAALSSSPNAEQ